MLARAEEEAREARHAELLERLEAVRADLRKARLEYSQLAGRSNRSANSERAFSNR